MGKIAFVFSGQGAQFPGMGLGLYETDEAARKIFREAESIRRGTARQCFESTDEELLETKNTQPCMYTVEMATAAALTEAGIEADMVAGFSLGELSAMTYSGVVDFATGLRLVSRRGELMQQASEQQPTVMAAVMKLSSEQLNEVCAQFSHVYPVNYNCPGQITVSALESELPAFAAAVRAAGGRAIQLKVRGGFHSPFMRSASEKFARMLNRCIFQKPHVKLYSNYTGQVYTDDTKTLLEKQICNPVRWDTVIRNMIAAGADTFIELGPGRTLCNLINKIDKNVRTFSVADKNDIDHVVAEVKRCL